MLAVSVPNAVAYEGKIYRNGDYDDMLHRHGEYDAGYDPNYDCNEIDNQKIKYFLNEKFAWADSGMEKINGISNCPAGWDADVSGGRLECTYFTCNFKMIDSSDKESVSIMRDFEKAKFGKITLETQFGICDDSMDGVSIGLYEDEEKAIKIISENGKIYLDDESKTFLFNYSKNIWYGLKITFDIDSHIIEKIQCNGKNVAENIAFSGNIGYINKFVADTGKNAVGTLAFNIVKIYRGYAVNETFVSAQGKVPDDFEVTGSARIVTMKSNIPPDTASLKISSNGTESSVYKKFDRITGKASAYWYMYTNPKTDGVYVSLLDDANGFSIKTHDGQFCYDDTDSEPVPFCNYKANVWYRIEIAADFDSGTADIYLNYKNIKKNIPLRIGGTNGFKMGITEKGSFCIDDITINETPEMPEDYVPMPNPVGRDDDYLVGMEFCPMWQNGYHWGYDHANSDKDRLSYLGYYDENSAEAMDWMIKWQVEHGVDFMKVTWAPSYEVGPTKYAYIGADFMEAYFNSKYKKMLPFMLMWENNVNRTTEQFLADIAPYWIEYYLKDENYFKLDGRPVISIYNFKKFLESQAGGDLEKAKSTIDRFKRMCKDDGIKEPIITVGMTETDEIMIRNMEYVGIEGIQSYGVSEPLYADEVFASVRNAVNSSGSTKITVCPTMGAGTDGTIGGSPSNGILTKNMFKEVLEKIKNVYLPGNPETSPLKNVILLDTWDEYIEGHWLAPSGRYGFDYLDAVREVFADSGKHKDCAPNMKQKDRFNNYYPYGRMLSPFKKEETKGMMNPEKYTIKYGWYFENGTEGWTGENISDLKAENGCLSAIPTNDDPMVYITGLNIDLRDISHIRVKFKPSKKSSVNQVFFGTEENPWFAEERSYKFGVYNDGMNEYMLWLGSNTYFNGTLKELRFDPGNYMDGGAFWIDSIELISDNSEQPRIENVSYSNNSVEFTFNNGMGESVFDTDNYSVDGNTISEVEKISDKAYKLKLAYPLKNGRHTITVNGLCDAYSQIVPVYSESFDTDGIVTEEILLDKRDFSGSCNRPAGYTVLDTDLGGRYEHYQTSLWHSILNVMSRDDDTKYVYKTGAAVPESISVYGKQKNITMDEVVFTDSDSIPPRVLRYEPLHSSADLLFGFPEQIKDGKTHKLALKFEARGEAEGTPLHWGKDKVMLSDSYGNYIITKTYNSSEADTYYYRDRNVYLNTDIGCAFYIGNIELYEYGDTAMVSSEPYCGEQTENVREIYLQFNNNLTDTAINAENYRLNGENIKAESISLENGKNIRIKLENPLPKGKYTLVCSNIYDEYGEQAEAGNISFEIVNTGIVFLDEATNGKTVTALLSDYSNRTAENKDLRLVLCSYDNEKLVNISAAEKKLEPYETVENMKTSIEISDKTLHGKCCIKSFLWSDMTPIISAEHTIKTEE